MNYYRVLLFFFFASGLIVHKSFAQWNSNTQVNTPVCTATNDQQNLRITEDGNGGAIVVWEDYRGNPLAADIYIQRINKKGYALWTPNGKPVCAHVAHQSNPDISFNNGRIVVTWNDYRNGYSDVYAQMLDTSGNVLWTSNGTPVVTANFTQNDARAALAMNGETFVVFQDSSAGNWNIMAQKLDVNGNRLWSSTGTVVCNAGYDQRNPRMEISSDGGIYVVWQDKRNGANYDIYCQKLNQAGNRLWNPSGNGFFVSSTVGSQINPKIDPFGSGFIVCWQDNRNGTNYDIYAQYISDNGIAQWAVNGIVVCNAGGNQSAHDIQSVGNRAVIVWKDARNTNLDIYAQSISTAGIVQWQPNGILLSLYPNDQINPNVEVDVSGNAYVVWQDSTSHGWDVTGAKISPSGNVLWHVSICDATNTQADPKNVYDGSGGTIIAWQDKRNITLSGRDVYIQKIFSNGSPDALTEWIGTQQNLSVYPNPASSVLKVASRNMTPPLFISIYSSDGKCVYRARTENEEITLEVSPVPSGVYCIEISDKTNKNFYQKWIKE